MTASQQNFSKLVPGFDFLQGLVKNAGAALPSIGQWVAPTLDPDELERRIEELRTVQFWLEQNARMLGATIQALEVQRMTLSTLKTMNVPLAHLRDSLKVREPAPAAALPVAAPVAPPAKSASSERPARGSRKKSPAETATPAVDPMQWWGALTKQFTQLAASAMKDSAGETARSLAGTMVKQSFDAAEQTLRRAAAVPVKAAGAVAQAAGASSGGGKARAAPRARKRSARR